MWKNSFIALIHFCAFTVQAQHQEYTPDTSQVIQQRLEDWQDLKFGLLMHWGTYSQWGIVESWSICPEDLSWAAGGRKPGVSDSYNDYVNQYEQLQTTFNPVKFNPEKWADAAGNAGMKYVVFTTKHHDGFCMFDTQYSDYKITDSLTPFSTNPRSNVTKEIFQAFRNDNFWIGAYFSKPDWHSDYYWWKRFPASDRNCNYSIQKYPERWEQFIDYTHNQINELLTDYGKVDILWLDGGWVRPTTEEEIDGKLKDVYEGSRWARNPQNQDIRMGELVAKSRNLQPGLIVVDRAVPGPYQNYLTPEQHIPETGLPYPWETCMTMATSWSYVPNDTYKPTEEIIEKLVDVVSKGGNFLLNIGPGPDGELDSVAYVRLREIGEWMTVNSEAIYNSRMLTASGESNTIRYTQSKDSSTFYVFFSEFPEGKVELKQLHLNGAYSMKMLGSSKEIKFNSSEHGTTLQLPSSLKKQGKHVWVVKVSKQ
jgi:alpha-L-fucosidase